MTFAAWSLDQFDTALSTLGDTHVATVIKARPSMLRLGATSPASSTPETALVRHDQTSQSSGTALFAIEPPGKAGKVYAGCTYPIVLRSPGKILTLETQLFNAGTQDVVPPMVSGLASVHTLSQEKPQITWKIGGVWPGVYYVSVPKINGTSLGERSSTFIIYAMPAALGSSEQKSLCESSGGTP